MDNVTRAAVGSVSVVGKHVAMLQFDIEVVSPELHHTVFMCDVSGSMSGSLNDVKRDTKTYLDKLGEKDMVSIIIFSGDETARLIAGPCQCNAVGKDQLRRAIDTMRILGTTLFSEPLKLALDTVKRQSGQDTVHNAVLFTDGCAVPTRCSPDEERTRALKAARALRDFGAVVSVIGYGVYYDEQFLNRLMVEGGNTGVFSHISRVDDFGPTIEKVRQVFEKSIPTAFDLVIRPNNGTADAVYRTTPEVSLSGRGGRIVTGYLYEGKLTAFVELSGPCDSLTIEGTINGKTVKQTVKPEKLSDQEAANFVCVLGAAAFIAGDTDKAAELLKLVDEGLAADVGSSYTDRDRREAGNLVRRIFADKAFIGSGIKPTGPNHNLLNVLRVLIEDKGNVVYIAKGAYKRSGELTLDLRVIEDPLGRTTKVIGYVSHADRFNFSVRVLKRIKLRPMDEAGNVLDGPETDSLQWRTYNVILDGNLHIDTLQASLSSDSFSKLQEAGVIDADAVYKPTKVYDLDLTKVKLISSAWSNPATLGFVDLLREEADLEEQQKALNAHLKALGKPVKEGIIGDVYYGKAKKAEDVVKEYYTALCCEYRLMKYSPKAIDVSNLNFDAADARRTEVVQRLATVRYLMRAQVFAMERCNSRSIRWDAGKTTQKANARTPRHEQLATFGGAQLKRVTWTEECVCS